MSSISGKQGPLQVIGWLFGNEFVAYRLEHIAAEAQGRRDIWRQSISVIALWKDKPLPINAAIMVGPSIVRSPSEVRKAEIKTKDIAVSRILITLPVVAAMPT